MSKEEFLDLNLPNFNNLINFNEAPKGTAARRNRLYSNTKLLREESKNKESENEYLSSRKNKVDDKSKGKPEKGDSKGRISSNKNIVDYKAYGNNLKSKESRQSGSS